MAGRRKVTLADVAALAGVSSTSASYILNGRAAEQRISGETEARVRQAAAQLRYRPNRNARVLRAGRGQLASRTIALVSDSIASGAYASQMLEGARREARAHDHLLVVGETGGDPEMTVRVIEEMLDRQVDGIVYATLVTREVSPPPGLRQAPAVLLNCTDADLQLPAVVPDEVAGGAAAARVVSGILGGAPQPQGAAALEIHLVGDHQDQEAVSAPLRMQGLVDELARAGLQIDGVIPTAWDVIPARLAVSAWLDAQVLPLGSRVLICLNDRVAMGAYQALDDHGLQVPRDTSVVSFDGSELGTWLQPPVTSVAIPYAEMGATAVRMLLDSVSVPTDPQQVARVAMEVHAGGSVRTWVPATASP